MQKSCGSDQPSATERMRFNLLRLRAPLSDFSDLSVSSSSSRKSVGISPLITPATAFSEKDVYDELEDIRVLRPSTGTQTPWSQQHKDYRNDLSSHLQQEPSTNSLNFMLRLRWVGKSNGSWRPSVLITTPSAKAKLTLASYLLRGPPILRRLTELQLDICIVRSREGLSGATEDQLEDFSEKYGASAWVDLRGSLNGALVVPRNSTAGGQSRTLAVGGGLLEVESKYIMMTALHPFKVTDKDDVEKLYESVDPPFMFDSSHATSGAIMIYHEEVTESDTQSDFSGNTPDQFVSTAGSVQGRPHSPLHDYRPLKSAMKRLIRTLTAMREGVMSASVLKDTSATKANKRELVKPINYTVLTPAMVLYQGATLDWAALDLMDFNLTGNQSVGKHNEIGGYLINEILNKEVDSARPVTIATNKARVRGSLLADTVSYHIDGRSLELQVVQLNKILPRGTSGSWVTARNHFCGMVIAVSDDIPEAYILPASVLVSDMEKLCGVPVKLPTGQWAGSKQRAPGINLAGSTRHPDSQQRQPAALMDSTTSNSSSEPAPPPVSSRADGVQEDASEHTASALPTVRTRPSYLTIANPYAEQNGIRHVVSPPPPHTIWGTVATGESRARSPRPTVVFSPPSHPPSVHTMRTVYEVGGPRSANDRTKAEDRRKALLRGAGRGNTGSLNRWDTNERRHL